jgi:hypothetical protein
MPLCAVKRQDLQARKAIFLPFLYPAGRLGYIATIKMLRRSAIKTNKINNILSLGPQ